MDKDTMASYSRRDFLTGLCTTVLAHSEILRLADEPESWAQTQIPSVSPGQFEIQRVAADVYFALAQPWALANSNTAIFVNSSDVLVVDAQSHPAAATALIAQIRKEVTSKPVRWLVNTHFHWDHTQGNSAYVSGGSKLDIVASQATNLLMSQLLVPRLRAALDPSSPGPRGSQQVARQLEELRQRAAKVNSESEKAPIVERIAQLEFFADEMKDFKPTLPTITFEKSYVIRDKHHDLHLEFHGLGHTAGDVVVFCPQKRLVVTGDVYHPGWPGFTDSYPQLWPKTIDSIANLQFDLILPGHGRVQHSGRDMAGQRNYIEELAERVITGRKTGQSVADLQRTITASSLKSLGSRAFMPAATTEDIERGVKENIDSMYDRVERVSFSGSEPLRLRQ